MLELPLGAASPMPTAAVKRKYQRSQKGTCISSVPVQHFSLSCNGGCTGWGRPACLILNIDDLMTSLAYWVDEQLTKKSLSLRHENRDRGKVTGGNRNGRDFPNPRPRGSVHHYHGFA